MIKFRCSSLHSLMTEPRSKSQELSETTKTFLNALAIEIETGRRKNIETACMKKGTQSEVEGITMFCEHFGVAFPYETEKENMILNPYSEESVWQTCSLHIYGSL